MRGDSYVASASDRPEPTKVDAAGRLADLTLGLNEATRAEIAKLFTHTLSEAQAIIMSMVFMPGVRAALDNLPADDPVEPYLEKARQYEAQSLSLSEAREEIERLRAAVTMQSAMSDGTGSMLLDVQRECIEFRRIVSAFLRCPEIAECAPEDKDPDTDALERRAQSALENGPAGLADANTNPASPSLSSLRKGAEVVGWMFTHEDGTRSFVSDPDTKRIWEETMKRVLVPVAALVSGSREDGDG